MKGQLGPGGLALAVALALWATWAWWPTHPWPTGGPPLSRADQAIATSRPAGPDAVALGRALVPPASAPALAAAWRGGPPLGQPPGPALLAWLDANRAKLPALPGAAQALAARADGVLGLEEADAVATLARLGQVACLDEAAQGRAVGAARAASATLALVVAAGVQVQAEDLALGVAQARRDRFLGWAWGGWGAWARWPVAALDAWAAALDEALRQGQALPQRLRALAAHRHAQLFEDAEADWGLWGWLHRPAFRVLGHQAWALARRDRAAMAWPEQALAHLQEGGEFAVWRQPLLALWLPELWPSLEAMRRFDQDQRQAQAQLLAMRLGVAILRHRQREGHDPQGLKALVPRDLPRWPEDPYAPGQPLRQAGLRAWSVAWDGVDQGGVRGVVVADRGRGRFRFDVASSGDLLLWPPHSFPLAPASP